MVWKIGETHNFGRWVQPTLSMVFWQNWGRADSLRQVGLEGVTGELVFLDGHNIIRKREYGAIMSRANESIRLQDDWVGKVCKIAEENVEKHWQIGEGLRAKKYGLREGLEKLFLSWHEICATWLLVIPLAIPFEEAIQREMLKGKIPAETIAQEMTPKKETPIMRQSRELREFAAEFKKKGIALEDEPEEILARTRVKDKLLYGRITKHLAGYEWVGTHHCWGNLFDSKVLFEQMRGACRKEHVATKAVFSGKLEWLLSKSRDLAYWRQYSAEASDMAAYWGRAYLSEAGEKIGLTYGQIIWLTDEEIIGGLDGKPVPDAEEIKRREKAFGLIWENGKHKVITGRELEKWLQALVPKPDSAVKEIKGLSASKGKAEGNARVALTPMEAEAIKEGEILIAPQTTPDFLPFMRKAAAIVTDEGGLTCHAAIVSRELGKPCVVGTKVSTQVFKTGERILVDAGKGIVKRLGA